VSVECLLSSKIGECCHQPWGISSVADGTSSV